MAIEPVTPEQMKKHDHLHQDDRLFLPENVGLVAWRAANLIADDFKTGFTDDRMVEQFAARIQQAIDFNE